MRSGFQHPEILDWFDRRNFGPSNPGPFAPDPGLLAELKRAKGLRASVCLPALNEQTTVGDICASIRTELMERTGLIDELIVVDSGSEDDTITVAAAAGPQVYRGCDVFPQVGHVLGKGEALWKSLAVSSGDLICWCDSDIRNFDPRFIVGLFTPLLIDDEIKMTKGFYRRPLEGDPTGGGRVTELVVRPLLHLLYPTLTGLIGPLSGEYALRRESRSRASLLHPLRGRLGRIKLTEDLSDALVQFIPKENGPVAVRFDQEIIERPPMANVLLPT